MCSHTFEICLVCKLNSQIWLLVGGFNDVHVFVASAGAFPSKFGPFEGLCCIQSSSLAVLLHDGMVVPVEDKVAAPARNHGYFWSWCMLQTLCVHPLSSHIYRYLTLFCFWYSFVLVSPCICSIHMPFFMVPLIVMPLASAIRQLRDTISTF